MQKRRNLKLLMPALRRQRLELLPCIQRKALRINAAKTRLCPDALCFSSHCDIIDIALLNAMFHALVPPCEHGRVCQPTRDHTLREMDAVLETLFRAAMALVDEI